MFLKHAWAMAKPTFATTAKLASSVACWVGFLAEF